MCSSRYKAPPSDAIQIDHGLDTSPIERIGLHLLRRILSRLTIGKLTIITPSGAKVTRLCEDRSGDHPVPNATLTMHRWRMLIRLIRHGDIGFAESYMDGDWSSPDIAALIELAARNRAALDTTLSGTWLTRIADRFKHLRRANTREGSKRNIMAHYDLGNDFYTRWLDDTMIYSSAIYERATDTLEEAQARKIDAIVKQLDLQGGERVLEIGCGWGALAKRLAQEGCDVVAVTLSPAQHAMARERVAAAGLADKADILIQDYRDVEGQFDRIVSIEMFEAVGEAYWTTYFGQIAARLKPGGRAVLQVITIDESRFEAYRNDVDFIQRYVFPGGMLPTPTLIDTLSAQAGLQLAETYRFGLSYALTLAEWNRRFQREWPTLARQGFDDHFKRLWEYYLKYCEGGFAAGAIDVGLYTLTSPTTPSA